ncbi:MAG: hypothetical protein ABJE47_15765, partial [bacterium]
LALGLTLLAGCSNDRTDVTSPLATPSAAPSGDLLGALGGLLNNTLSLVGNVKRTTPLAAAISVQQTIGAAGGTMTIPSAGVTVVFPAGALASNTTITMTARAGSAVAYDFAPHGITFAKPLVFTQNLSGTNVSLLTAPLLNLGYYTDPSLIGTVTTLVSELIGGTTNLLSWKFTSSIRHFSGYMVACGRGGASDE